MPYLGLCAELPLWLCVPRFIDIKLLERCNRVKQLTTDRAVLTAGMGCLIFLP